jgi:hypothetical protein
MGDILVEGSGDTIASDPDAGSKQLCGSESAPPAKMND